MASATSFIVVAQALPAHPTSQKAHARKHAPAALPTRRQCLLLLTAATTAFKATEMPSRAQDIPLFGLRQGLRKAEQEAEQIVKEGFEAAEKGVVTAEKGIEAAEKGLRLQRRGLRRRRGRSRRW
ncbi:hypothetical protein PHJA_000240400 [Phtheirospermum japonicum]|uniref:Uncharacterized protein n=1 Tax=Phtheirospermum japonicum TaxID=374723 RepID=A0A830BG06_9LAMI|nr:hypothetical protein PHJA_000240400 [Phtheirospermum japonicum]